jgi:hypothetical protein
MKTVFLTVLGAAFCTLAFAQAPGGVQGMRVWYVTAANAPVPSLQSKTGGNASYLPLVNPPAGNGLLNGYPALVFSAGSHLTIDLDSLDLSSAGYFTVYQPRNLVSENIIWHIRKGSAADLVLTTGRMADLGLRKYMNYTDVEPLLPKVNTYIQQKPKDTAVRLSQAWHIGSRPQSPELPVVAFEGLMPELVAYDRVLDAEEQVKVASYLALKYGITLSEPGASYLNSRGGKIWDGESYSKYHHNIAAILRDDSSGLLQKRSSSSNTPDLLTLTTTASLQDNASLLWGDNGQALMAGEPEAGVPPVLQRRWLLVPYGLNGPIATNMEVDTRQMDLDLPADPVYWLAVDRSGKGDFSSPGTEFIRMSRLDNKGKAHFDNVLFHKNLNGREAFGFVMGGEILMSVRIEEPHCNDLQGGSFRVKAWGGSPPYKLNITRNGQPWRTALTLPDLNALQIDGIPDGLYRLTLTDARQQTYSEQFQVNSKDAPRPFAVQSRYVLSEGARLEIDAADGMPAGVLYKWVGPGKFQSSEPQVTLINEGEYVLTCTANGCSYVHKVLVTRPPKNSFLKVKVFPNPSAGDFRVQLSLDKAAPVIMDILAEDGRLVASQQVKGFTHYTISGHLNVGGLYYIVLRSGLSVVTEKLVIAK